MNSSTLFFGVIGDPIAHSKSPLMMNRAFREYSLNMAYGAFHVTPDRLSAALEGVRALRMRGLNVTIPHKEAVIPLLDELDESAAIIGAVNTIVNHDGVLRGYNTDGIGYVRSLETETGMSLEGASVAVLGAGGAARAVIYALLRRGVRSVRIVNRTLSRAQRLAEQSAAWTIEGAAHSVSSVMPSTPEELPELAAELDLLINTTSVGMSPDVSATPLEDVSWMGPRLLVSDLIYNPRQTRLLEEARAQGARIHGGLGMLVNQGAFAFEYWTGQVAPVAAMWEEVEGKS